ncbi:MAG: ketoacyl-ACP synthase III [Candidatus Cloacimonetes bacterium]|nr:ketoacyl-ACP synthase III [Candidatus Cloacimonadota bacterium]MCK9333959.1 ketoacyl-ACP synthase III [Candidatus Cloacimonadota bacterium]
MKISSYLPERVLSNEELSELFPEWTPKKIEKKLGVRTRHISAQDETALDMAVKASERIFESVDRGIIDYLLLCTQSPDYLLPTSACILQDRLGLRTEIGALDFNLGCSGFIYGLSLAKGLLSAGIAENVLLVVSETYSKHLHPRDKGNRSIFGDAASAMLVDKSFLSKIHEFALGTDGKGWSNLIIPNSGMRNILHSQANDWTDENGVLHNDDKLFMNGPEIFNFTIEAVPKLINQVLEKNRMSLDDIDYVIFHQANQYMLQYLRDIVGITEDKFFIDMTDTGNTVSATIPIALEKCLRDDIVKQGDQVLLAGFGVGYSYGATIITI